MYPRQAPCFFLFNISIPNALSRVENKRRCSSLVFSSFLQTSFPQYNLISFKIFLSLVASPLQLSSTFNFVE